MNYYYSINEATVEGPCSLSQLKKYSDMGLLPSSTRVCLEGQQSWEPIASVIDSDLKQPPSPHQQQYPILDAKLPTIPTHLLGRYAASTLQQNERAILKATIHWVVFLQAGILALFFSIVSAKGVDIFLQFLEKDYKAWEMFWVLFFLFFLIFGAVFFVWALETYCTSEFVITDKRVLTKFGFVSRRTKEIFIRKIESIDINQRIFGRLFNYGTIIIRGTGGSAEGLPNIARPIQFRNYIQRIQSHNEEDGQAENGANS